MLSFVLEQKQTDKTYRFEKYRYSEPIEGSILHKVKKAVCKKLGVTHEQVDSPSRKKDLVTARQMIVYLTKFKVQEITLIYLGYKIGERDHSTVIHLLQKADDFLVTEKKFLNIISELRQELFPELFEETM